MALTLEQIISNALGQIGESTDAQKTSEWNDPFLTYANEAQLDLARRVRRKRTDNLVVTGGKIQRSDFTREVLKVSSIKAGSTAYNFSEEDPEAVTVSGLTSGTVSVTYEYAPADMKDGQEYPDIPASLHAAIPLYISYRYYMTRDQSKAQMFKYAYDAMKSGANSNIGGDDKYALLNLFS